MSAGASVELAEVMATRLGSVDPSKHQDEVFDLYSIPAFDRGQPDIVAGRDVGSTKQVVQPGDVLISRIVPHIRRSWVVGPNRGRPIIASGEWIVFRSPRLHPAYLQHVLIGDPFHQQFMSTVAGVGGSLMRARPAQVAKIHVPLPPLPEQRRIAEMLDRAEALRAQRRAAIAQLDTLTQSIFLDMFGDPATNPKGWHSSALGNVAATTSGGTPDRMVLEYFGGGIPWVKSGELHQRIVSATEETLTQRGLKESSAKLMPPGTVLVAMYGATVGASAILGVEAATNQAICSILPTQELLADYLVHLLQRFAPTLLAKRVGGAQPNLSQELIRQLVIPLPPYELQQGFVSRVREVDRVRASHSLSLASFDALFSSIQALAFSGEL